METGSIKNRNKRPIIIIGCPRSGTQLASRLIGGYEKHFLFTDHGKNTKPPEDTTDFKDNQLWWDNFKFPAWDSDRGRALIESPIYDENAVLKVKDTYLRLSEGKRLVIKSTNHLLKLDILKEMFPDALYVFCVRNPWDVLNSMAKKGKIVFGLKSERNFNLPDDLLLKAAVSWQESFEIYMKEKNNDWILLKYEELLEQPEKTLRATFHFLGVEDEAFLEKVISLPKNTTGNNYLVKKMLNKNKFKKDILESLKPGCDYFSYSSSIESVESDAFQYYVSLLKKKFFKK